MITINFDFARRLYVVCGNGEPVAAFRTYKGAASLWKDLQMEAK